MDNGAVPCLTGAVFAFYFAILAPIIVAMGGFRADVERAVAAVAYYE